MSSNLIMFSYNNKTKYSLVTPAKNAELTIENTIISVLNQTVRPIVWAIVDDNSTDNTQNIIKSFSRLYSFIKYVKHISDEYNFESKVNAFNQGLMVVRKYDVSFIGNLDSDITLKENYYESLFEYFKNLPNLGIAGGQIIEISRGKTHSRYYSADSVAGGIQMFRTKCFLDIGGYLPLKLGAIDTVAETTAKMKGWDVKTFSSLIAYHQGSIGHKNMNLFLYKYKKGQREYSIGSHPLFIVFKYSFRLFEHPLFLGSIAIFCGYYFSLFTKKPILTNPSFVKYLRHSQLLKLKHSFFLFR